MIYRRIVGRLMNNEFERMWKELVVNYFKVLLQNLLEGDEKRHKSFSHGSRRPSLKRNRAPSGCQKP
jgi:hypothetical protein